MLVKSEIIAKAEDLNGMAAKLMPMPEDLTQPEQLLYKSLCLLYREYRSGQITREQALKDKKQMYSAYIDSAYMFDLYETYGKISEVFQHHSYEIKESGCDVCRRLDRLICGLPMRRRENERK